MSWIKMRWLCECYISKVVCHSCIRIFPVLLIQKHNVSIWIILLLFRTIWRLRSCNLQFFFSINWSLKFVKTSCQLHVCETWGLKIAVRQPHCDTRTLTMVLPVSFQGETEGECKYVKEFLSYLLSFVCKLTLDWSNTHMLHGTSIMPE